MKHSFIILAYQGSPYLEECILSLKNQVYPSKILISSRVSTPRLEQLATTHQIPMHLHAGDPGIGNDWNAACKVADTDYFTLAHQDDVYGPTYSREMVDALSRSPNVVLAFSDYAEIDTGVVRATSALLRTKRLLCSPLHPYSPIRTTRLAHRLSLQLGNPIACPSITYVRKQILQISFSSTYKFVLDWDFLLQVHQKGGLFCYTPKILVNHRIHQGSETSRLSLNKVRLAEEEAIFKRLWPSFVVKLLMHFYKGATPHCLSDAG